MNAYLTSLRAKVIATISSGGVIAASALALNYFEGFSLDAHLDPTGHWEVCSGVRITAAEAKAHPHWTKAECDAADSAALARAQSGWQKCVKVDVDAETSVALNLFAYNVGVANACGSSAVKYLNAGNKTTGCAKLNLWVKSRKNGVLVKLPGLVTRRDFESNLCLFPSAH